MSFFPLDRDILSSSLWCQGSGDELKVWIYLLLNANPGTGIVADTDPAIAMHCGIELDRVDAILSKFAEPDRYSRTETKDGRRIERVKGRIRLINYTKHANKDYSTPRVKRWRERNCETKRNGVKRENVTETTDTDTDTDKNKDQKSGAAPASPSLVHPSQEKCWWDKEQKRVWGTEEWRSVFKGKWLEFFDERQFKAHLAYLNAYFLGNPEKRGARSNIARRCDNIMAGRYSDMVAREKD